MPRFYDPKTGTEALEGIHDTEGATPDTEMPAASRAWFERPAREGMQWQNDPTGKFPIEVPIPPPTTDQLKAVERQWAYAELVNTDPIMLPDSPYTAAERTQVETYRAALRNPAREATSDYPADTWRPAWPEGVDRIGE